MGVLLVPLLFLAACRSRSRQEQPSVRITNLPLAGEGDADTLLTIAGQVTGAQPGQRIVLFSRAGVWWVQPFANAPYTPIVNGRWQGHVHPGVAYAALLVSADYKAPATAGALPDKSADVLAVVVGQGHMAPRFTRKTLQFRGYDWEIRQAPSDPGGSHNLYQASNAFLDRDGNLHLRISKRPGGWNSAEVTLGRSLGYGLYRFKIRNVSHLEPAAILTLSVRDNGAAPREMDIETGRWGQTNSKNAQYVIQPYYLPANVKRFVVPPGTLTYSFYWQPGRASFRAMHSLPASGGSQLVTQHVFTSGIPLPGNESIHMNLYVFDNMSNPLQHPVEVVIEDFEYLP